ncbi:hypothetical protein QTO34_009257 [Cnephaeus nilssonii]|uniref:Uncharacterized protein n=1 Tax=Cnephaeus nilssonii TaxID=3371016 RepID=A0AA40LFX5_CNENI|nr:hypothetical protein QTO34_009257 [Eptesicus nilssonii]
MEVQRFKPFFPFFFTLSTLVKLPKPSRVKDVTLHKPDFTIVELVGVPRPKSRAGARNQTKLKGLDVDSLVTEYIQMNKPHKMHCRTSRAHGRMINPEETIKFGKNIYLDALPRFYKNGSLAKAEIEWDWHRCVCCHYSFKKMGTCARAKKQLDILSTAAGWKEAPATAAALASCEPAQGFWLSDASPDLTREFSAQKKPYLEFFKISDSLSLGAGAILKGLSPSGFPAVITLTL